MKGGCCAQRREEADQDGQNWACRPHSGRRNETGCDSTAFYKTSARDEAAVTRSVGFRAVDR
jgi:hypothetical protein